MLLNSSEWKWSKFNWQSNWFYAYGLYIKHRSHILIGPFPICNIYIYNSKNVCDKISKTTEELSSDWIMFPP